jgi:hypothetical protein
MEEGEEMSGGRSEARTRDEEDIMGIVEPLLSGHKRDRRNVLS